MKRKSVVSLVMIASLTLFGFAVGTGPVAADPAPPAKPPATCAAPPSGADATAANRDRFISLWAPRVKDQAWFSNFVGLTSVPDDIKAEGFNSMDQPTQAWLVACLVDNLVAASGQPASADQIANYQLSLDLVIFGKDQLAAAKAQLNEKAAPPTVTPPVTPAPSNLTAAALSGMIARLGNEPSITSASLPTAGNSGPSVQRVSVPNVSGQSGTGGGSGGTHHLAAAGLNPLSLATSLQSILSSPLVALILNALNALEQLISKIEAVLFTLPVLNLTSALFYKVCAESPTQPLACSVSLPIGIPIPADVNGDHFPDVLAELIPVVANGTDFGVSFSVIRLPTTTGPLPAHIFFVYDIPLANKRLEYGYDGRASTLATSTTTTVTLKNAFRALTGDINVTASVTSQTPGAVEALTFAVKDLVGGSAGHPPTEANPMAGVVQFNPFPAKLTMGAHLTHNAQDENIFTLASTTPSTVTAAFDQQTTTTTPQSHTQYTALIDKLPTSVTVDMTHNGDTQNVNYTASAPIAHIHVSAHAVGDVVNHPNSYTDLAADVLGVPQAINLALTRTDQIQDITYAASSAIPQVTFSTQTYADSVLQNEITAQAQGVPANVHVSDVNGDTSTITYDASSVITSIAVSMFDVGQDPSGKNQTNLQATATSIPTHLQFVMVKSTGLYDLQANAGIGLITATLLLGKNGMSLPDPGVDHATVYKRGDDLGLDFQLSGFQSAHFENGDKTIISLGLNPGGQAFDAIADLDGPNASDPNLLATAHITQLPSTVTVTVDPTTSSYTYAASSPINAGLSGTPDVSASLNNRATGDLLSAGITDIPQTVTLTFDSANSKIGWDASAATGKVAVSAHLTAATLNQPRDLDAALTITGIPATWTATYGNGNVDFEAPSPGIASIDAWVTNHGSYSSLGGDFLAADYDQSSGDLDAALHISDLSRAKFSKLTDSSGGGFSADLNMGNHSNFAFAANVNLTDPQPTQLVVTGSLNPLPASIHLQSDGGRIRYTGDTNPTLTLSLAAGDPAAVAATPTPPFPAQGIAIRDGQSGGNEAVKANLLLTGLPDNLDLNTPAGVYTVSNYHPSIALLTVDAQLTTLAAQPITLELSQDVGTSPVSFVFGPFLSSTAGDGTHSMSVNYTASRTMGAFNAEVTYGHTDDAKLYISNIPGGSAPSLSVNAAFGATTSIDVAMAQDITEIKAQYKHVGDASFGGCVDLTNVPDHVNLKLGSATTGDTSNGATAPQMTFTASHAGLNISAFARASIVNASAVASLIITNMGATVTGALSGMNLNVTSSPATGSFLIDATAHVHVDAKLDFSAGPFVNHGHLGLDIDVRDVTIGLTNFSSIGLALGVTTGLTGDFTTFTFGLDLDITLKVVDLLSFDFSLPVIGDESIPLVTIGDPDTNTPAVFPFDNVVPNWHIQTNTFGSIISLPVFEIPFIIECHVGVKARPGPGSDTGTNTIMLPGPPPSDGNAPPAYLITPGVFGLSGFLMDVIGFFETPYSNDIEPDIGCS